MNALHLKGFSGFAREPLYQRTTYIIISYDIFSL